MRFYIEVNKLQKDIGILCLKGKVYSLDTDFVTIKVPSSASRLYSPSQKD